MNKPASIFLTNVTVIDGAFVTERGMVEGASFNPKFVVTGPVTEDEQVVIDFGRIKKKLKEWIDDKAEGFDHKLWFCEGLSSGHVQPDLTSEGGLSLVTPMLKATGDDAYIRVIPDVPATWAKIDRRHDLVSALKREITIFISEKLAKEFPGVHAQVILSTDASDMGFTLVDSSRLWFRYSHGLRNSTSFGCQQPLHGHLSYLQLLKRHDNEFMPCPSSELFFIRKSLDEAVFVDKANLVCHDATETRIAYSSMSRGKFTVWYNSFSSSGPAHKVILLDTETTVEHLADWIKVTYWDSLRRSGATHLAVSEGLTKGAIVELV